MAHLVTGYKGAAHITPADDGAFNAALIGTGDYVLPIGERFKAQIITNNSVRIFDGNLVMQGRHVNIPAGTYEDVTIANGAQDTSRNDLIVMRYTKDGATGIETAELAVVQGTATSGIAEDPAVITGDILAGAEVHEMPLYRVSIVGLTAESIAPLFTAIANLNAKPNTLADLGITASDTELNYMKGVTSGVQGQLNKKVESLSNLGITATATELNYMDGVTSGVQGQLDEKASKNQAFCYDGHTGGGESFNKNFLHVSKSDRFATSNQRAYWYKPDDTGWTNIPPGLEGLALGMREVFHYDTDHFFVKITEFVPVNGRTWINVYDYGWRGWKADSPIAGIANNATTTAEGYAADARQIKAIMDTINYVAVSALTPTTVGVNSDGCIMTIYQSNLRRNINVVQFNFFFNTANVFRTGDYVGNIPAGFRPSTETIATNCRIQTDGNVYYTGGGINTGGGANVWIGGTWLAV